MGGWVRAEAQGWFVFDDACGTDDDELWGLTHSSDAPVVSRSPRCVPAVPKGDHDPQGEHSQPEYQSSAKGDGGGTSSRRVASKRPARERATKVIPAANSVLPRS